MATSKSFEEIEASGVKQKHPGVEPVARETPEMVDEQLGKLKESFPEAFSEGKVDFEKLKATLGEVVDGRPERYSFTWAGKRDCIRLLQTPSRATLLPCPEESIDWDTTNNLFIEGDNLDSEATDFRAASELFAEFGEGALDLRTHIASTHSERTPSRQHKESPVNACSCRLSSLVGVSRRESAVESGR
jgi:hypothetical protein